MKYYLEEKNIVINCVYILFFFYNGVILNPWYFNVTFLWYQSKVKMHTKPIVGLCALGSFGWGYGYHRRILVKMVSKLQFYKKKTIPLKQTKYVLHDRPFITWLSQRAQYGKRTSFGKRMWFIGTQFLLLSFLLVVLFIHFILDIKKACCYTVKQLKHNLLK